MQFSRNLKYGKKKKQETPVSATEMILKQLFIDFFISLQ